VTFDEKEEGLPLLHVTRQQRLISIPRRHAVRTVAGSESGATSRFWLTLWVE
jgi:hypothetical protein